MDDGVCSRGRWSTTSSSREDDEWWCRIWLVSLVDGLMFFPCYNFVLFLLRLSSEGGRKSPQLHLSPCCGSYTCSLVYWKLVTSNNRRPRVSITRQSPFHMRLTAEQSETRGIGDQGSCFKEISGFGKFGEKEETKRALSLIKGHKFWFLISKWQINVLINVRRERRKK